MITTPRLAGAFAVLLACSATSAMAQSNGPAIPGECRIVEQRSDGMVVAECPSQGGERASAIRPAECRSSIVSRDGVLACTGTTAIVGPLRTSQQQSGLGGFLASVLGTQQPQQEMDMEWSRGSQPLGQRRADIEARIEAGSRDGSLTRNEAAALRRDHDALIRLESQYAADGQYSANERADLANRNAALSARLGAERRDGQGYDMNAGNQWQPMAERRGDFDRRVAAARGARVITAAEASRLGTDWQGLMRLEAQYRGNGIDAREQADLDARLLGLERRLGRFGQQAGAGQSGDRWGMIETRIANAERNRSLNPNQLERLRTEHGDLVRLDAAWRRTGIGATEQAYLTRRHAELSARLEQMQNRR